MLLNDVESSNVNFQMLITELSSWINKQTISFLQVCNTLYGKNNWRILNESICLVDDLPSINNILFLLSKHESTSYWTPLISSGLPPRVISMSHLWRPLRRGPCVIGSPNISGLSNTPL